MRKFVLGLATGATLSVVAGAQAVDIPLTLNSVGTSGVAAGNTSYADNSNANGNVELYNETGSGFAWARYDLATPVPLAWVDNLTYTVKVLSGNFPSGNYIANPAFLIDADNTGGINAGTNPPVWIDSTNPADLGAGGPNAGDGFISSDVALSNGNLAAAQAGFVTFELFAPPTEVNSGWYANTAARTPWDGVNTPDGPTLIAYHSGAGAANTGIDANELIYSVYVLNGGSGAFANHGIEISGVTLTIPEPASLGLLGLGGLLMLKRRRTA